MYDVYIIKCADGYLYTGLSGNLAKRINEHDIGLSRITKNRGKITLVYRESFETRKKAAKREKEIKGWKRIKKERLINCNDNVNESLH